MQTDPNPKTTLIIQNSDSINYQSQKISQDLIAGSIAGFTNAFCGHPLDTIKVRMQVLNARFWSCCKNMVKQEGLTSLYKGVKSPLMSAPLVTALSFGSYEVSKKFLGVTKGQKITFGKGLLAGGWAGFLYAGISTPIELIKCRLQMEGAGQIQKSSSPMKMALNTLKHEGLFGLYKGYWITCLRDIPGGAVQFGAYELYKNLFSEDSSSSSFFAGGLAKLTTWFFCYPQDLIKTQLQCKNDSQSVRGCVREIWSKYGSAGFWRGSLPSIMRTVVSGAITFTVYEEVKKMLSGF